MTQRTREIGENIIYKNKVVRFILIHLNKKENYANNLAREIKINVSNVIHNLKELRELGLIEFVEIKERRRYHKLTDKGKRIVELLLKIDGELKK